MLIPRHVDASLTAIARTAGTATHLENAWPNLAKTAPLRLGAPAMPRASHNRASSPPLADVFTIRSAAQGKSVWAEHVCTLSAVHAIPPTFGVRATRRASSNLMGLQNVAAHTT